MDVRAADQEVVVPVIARDESFARIVKKLSVYIADAIVLPSTFEQLRTTSAGNKLRDLVDSLVENVTNPAIVNALLTLKWHFSTLDPDDRGLNESRANACEIVAWRFLTRVSERDAIDFCLYDLPPPKPSPSRPPAEATGSHNEDRNEPEQDERSSLLSWAAPISPGRALARREQLIQSVTDLGGTIFGDDEAENEETDPSSSFTGLNALEIAGIAEAKKFLSQRLIQKIIYGIWTGEITFWETLSVHTKKKAQFYNKRKSDPFSRLRVPKYIKAFEVLFFASFLALYYAVLVERNPYRITPLEVLLYIWLAAFAYDELSEFVDAGLFYYADFWSSWDLAIILNGAAFLITRIVGLVRNDARIVDTAFDILSLEALFLVPRICSLLSLHPYFGTLIPCLKEMAKDFIKFMSIVAILYIGFLTTFTLLARDHFTLTEMSWILVKVFFGSSYVGFEVMHEISYYLGPPLMLIFVCMTNILLVTSLISILSNSFSKVTARAREEYLYVYSVYVLEASTSNRLTHFYPPLNLIPLILIRPLRLFIPSEDLRSTRIILLKATHAPIVAAIWLYETLHFRLHGSTTTFIGPSETASSKVQRSFPGINRPPVPFAARPVDEGSPFAKKAKGRKIVRDSREFAATVDTVALEAKVEDLSAKIAELTALIMAQQDKGAPE